MFIWFCIQRLRRFIRVGNLQDIDFILRYSLRQNLQTSLELLVQVLFPAFPLNQSRSSRRIRPFAARGLERIEAETDVGPINFLYDLPDVFPIWGVGGPAPILVGEAESVCGEKVAEFTKVGGEVVEGGKGMGRIGGADLCPGKSDGARNYRI